MSRLTEVKVTLTVFTPGAMRHEQALEYSLMSDRFKPVGARQAALTELIIAPGSVGPKSAVDGTAPVRATVTWRLRRCSAAVVVTRTVLEGIVANTPSV